MTDTKREIEFVLEKMEINHSSIGRKLDRIEQRTIETNGRISKLENWRSFLTGGLAVVTIMIVPIIIWIIRGIL